MARRGPGKYLGIVFIGVIIVPAVVLSLLAIRAIGREEAYIEKQFEGTLLADVTLAASVIAAEVGAVQADLAETARVPEGSDPAGALDDWKRNSPLVEIAFLLSPEHEIIWPVLQPPGAKKDGGKETSFAAEQKDFFSGSEEILVYENIAVAFQDEILDEPAEAEETAGRDLAAPITTTRRADSDRAGAGAVESEPPEVLSEARDAGDAPLETARPEKGAESRKQAAITEFQQSPETRQKVFDKAEMDGQEILYRNVAPAQLGESEAVDMASAPAAVDKERAKGPSPEGTGDKRAAEVAEAESRREMDAAADDGAHMEAAADPEAAGRIRSMFVAQPLSFGEIVADRSSGIIPRTIDGALRHIYWQRLEDGNILGCLIDRMGFRERLVGTLTNIYSPVRVLAVLDESGIPLVIPQGQEDRDWREPFVAVEISELLPRWESAAYLTEADVISSRARVTTAVMWILIFILFVSILAGGALVLRSAFAEVRLARQRTSFVANVSHELKTPLTSIRMYAEMLRDGRQKDMEKQKQYLDIMTAEAERLTRLINNVLDFSRIERGEKRYNMARCDLVELARRIVENQRARLEAGGFEVIFTARAGRLEVRADEEAVTQTIVNLLSNAEKYSSQPGEIRVEAGAEGDFAVVRVSDRGVGIPLGEVESIFDEFYRVDDTLTSEVKGAGLGLTIARKIVDDHGGDIRYAAREGGGSVFSILLPLAQERQDAR